MQSKTYKPKKNRVHEEWVPITYIHAEELGLLILPLLTSEPRAVFEVRKAAGRSVVPGVTMLAIKRALTLLSSKGLAHRCGGSYSGKKPDKGSDTPDALANAVRQSRYTERSIISARGAEFLKKGGGRFG